MSNCTRYLGLDVHAESISARWPAHARGTSAENVVGDHSHARIVVFK